MAVSLVMSEEQPLQLDSTTMLENLKNGIRFYLSEMGKNVIEIGKHLLQAKELIRHGAWQIWLEDNLSISPRTARRFMQIAGRFGKTVDVDRFSYSHLTEMLSLPEEEKEKFLEEQATAGQIVSEMSVKTLRHEIQKYKAKLAAVNGVVDDADSAVDSHAVNPSDSRINADSSAESHTDQLDPQNKLDQLFNTMNSLKSEGNLQSFVEQSASKDMQAFKYQLYQVSLFYNDIQAYFLQWELHQKNIEDDVELVDKFAIDDNAKYSIFTDVFGVKPEDLIDEEDYNPSSESLIAKLCDKVSPSAMDRPKILLALKQITLDDKSHTRSKYIHSLLEEKGFKELDETPTKALHNVLYSTACQFHLYNF